MTVLNTEVNTSDPDGLYQKLIELHAGRDDADSMKLLAKLVLILANHIGDPAVIEEALELASAK